MQVLKFKVNEVKIRENLVLALQVLRTAGSVELFVRKPLYLKSKGQNLLEIGACSASASE